MAADPAPPAAGPDLAPVPPLPPASDGTLPAATVAMFLNSGGDERIRPDPLTGRTAYGTTGAPTEDEIWFSAATASAIDPRSFAAAADVLGRLVGSGHADTFAVKIWFDQLRGRLAELFGIAGAEVVLTGSGTEAEFLAASVAQAILPHPLTNIVVAPTEAGGGVTLAAAGRHFSAASSLMGSVHRGVPLRGFDLRPIEVRGIAVRDAAGHPRDPAAIDREAAILVAQELAAGRDVLLHVLDASETGLSGVTRETARALAVQARGRLMVVVDACQLRCTPERLQHDLEAGFMVMITGSKFAGGPPLAGALLLSPSTIERLRGKAPAPAGLGAYSARLDWPQALRESFAAGLDVSLNFGLGLRWEAALAAIEPYFGLPEALRLQILTWFAGAVHRRVTARPHLRQLPAEPSRGKTIIPIETEGDAEAIHAALAAPEGPPGAPDLARVCHLSAPMPIGERMALRISPSMPLVLDIAVRIIAGQRIEAAVAPVVEDLDILFKKWDGLVEAR